MDLKSIGSRLRMYLRYCATLGELPRMEAFIYEQWIPAGSKVLIFEYGSRKKIETLAKKECKIVIASSSKWRLDHAKKMLGKYKDITYQKIEGYKNLPFKEGSFDAVVLSFLSHKFSLQNAVSLLKQLSALVKSGGVVVHAGEAYIAPSLQAVTLLPRVFILLLMGYRPYFLYDMGQAFRKSALNVVYRKKFFVTQEVLVGKQ
jgi:ubiquinone/menaquinone biosynthesis C-methylase UbiE